MTISRLIGYTLFEDISLKSEGNFILIWRALLLLFFTSNYVESSSSASSCIKTKVGTSCESDTDCYQFEERHLYCNKTHGANVCAFQVHTYASQSEENKDCPGEEFQAEPWSNPISDDWINYARGVDCLRLCYLTKTCFAISVVDHKCYLKNDKCLSNLKPVPGALFGVLSVTREDYKCGCKNKFERKRSTGEILSWDSDCPESQLNRNPYRCCSEKGLCVKCENGMRPRRQVSYNELWSTVVDLE